MKPANFIDMTGQRFGRLLVLENAESKIRPNGSKRSMWKCKCDCGNIKIVGGTDLRRGLTTSCGCYRDEHNREVQSKENKYDLSGEYGVCYFNNGGHFVFDLEDYDKLKEYTWCRRMPGYASCTRKVDGRIIAIIAARLIMDVTDKNLEVDHIDGNTSNNRKSNLRVVSHLENMQNKKIYKNNTSGTTGVSQLRNGKWKARIMVNGNEMWLGTFETKEEAVYVRHAAEEKYFGEMRRKV